MGALIAMFIVGMLFASCLWAMLFIYKEDDYVPTQEDLDEMYRQYCLFEEVDDNVK